MKERYITDDDKNNEINVKNCVDGVCINTSWAFPVLSSYNQVSKDDFDKSKNIHSSGG
jgi:hypothetical protein